jgi:hypothetical protein
MPALDPLHICIGLGPLAMYFLALGRINLAARPILTMGGRDFIALGIALSGLVVVGPMELFVSESAAQVYGWAVWAIMLTAYGLCVLLFSLVMRPRLVVYNVTPEQLRLILEGVVNKLDDGARWAGNALALPGLGIQLYLESFPATKNMQLVSSGPEQSLPGWRRLAAALAAELRSTRTTPNPVGYYFMFLGLAIASGITVFLAYDPPAVTQSLQHLLRR